MNQESEEDMAEDVEDNPELYQALDDSNENAYKSMEVDKTGGIYNGFWWSEWGRLNSLKEDTGSVLGMMWIGIILSSVLYRYMLEPWYSIALIYIFLVVCTVVWWEDLKEQEEWCGEYSVIKNE